jgi:hypothetical protein
VCSREMHTFSHDGLGRAKDSERGLPAVVHPVEVMSIAWQKNLSMCWSECVRGNLTRSVTILFFLTG